MHQEYVDDTQLYVEMTDRGSLDRLLRCIHCLQHWFLRNHLLLRLLARKNPSPI